MRDAVSRSAIGLEDRFEKGVQTSWVGIIVNVLLTAFKFVAGVLGQSQAMLADAVESSSDVIATIAVLISFRISHKPVDWDHPYGHGRAESIATAFIAVVIASAGILIMGRTIYSIAVGRLIVPGFIALIGAIVTIVVKEALYQYVSHVGRRYNSSLLLASAADHRKDALTSVATLVGIAGARVGYPILDPLAAGLVSLMIFRLSYQIATTATRELMDRLPEDATMKKITDVSEGCEGVEHAFIRARRLGPSIYVDVKIDIDPDLTVSQGHEIAKRVKERVIDDVEGAADVMVHVNPHYD